jgi:hypothetical protein
MNQFPSVRAPIRTPHHHHVRVGLCLHGHLGCTPCFHVELAGNDDVRTEVAQERVRPRVNAMREEDSAGHTERLR